MRPLKWTLFIIKCNIQPVALRSYHLTCILKCTTTFFLIDVFNNCWCIKIYSSISLLSSGWLIRTRKMLPINHHRRLRLNPVNPVSSEPTTASKNLFAQHTYTKTMKHTRMMIHNIPFHFPNNFHQFSCIERERRGFP